MGNADNFIMGDCINWRCERVYFVDLCWPVGGGIDNLDVG